MGSMHSLHKFLPNLAEVSAALRPLLSQNNDFVWTPNCENAFQQLKSLVKNIVELRHFDTHRETRIICDASHDGPGAVLEQYSASGWHPISLASRFLNPAEKKYSTNELELLAVVWATEHFRNYIYGRYFTVILDHKALLTLSNSSPKGNKTFFSRLTRWYDRLVPYDFKVDHRQGSKIGMADYLSRFPSAAAHVTSHYDESFTVAKIKMINGALKPKEQLKPGGQKVKQIRQNPAVEGERSCLYSKRKVVSNEIKRKVEYAKINCESTRSLEGVVTCNRRLANQNRDICILAEMCKLRSKKIRRCSQYVKSSCCLNEKIKKSMSSINSPEKTDPKTPSAIVNTSTPSGNVNLSVVLNRFDQPPSLSSDSDIEVIPPDKVITKMTSSKKLNTFISLPHQLPGLSYPLVQSDKWIYSIVPTDSRIVKEIDYPERDSKFKIS